MKDTGISDRLNSLFVNRLNINFDNYEESILDSPLLGNEIGLAARDLIYVFFDIEKEFNIQIPQHDIASGGFNTFNSICEVISKQIKIKLLEPVK
ncbi:peptide maturation system acyl carrier-related protein [Anaerobacterium chartisolvens]|uniref:Peptide maturation system acyl carrier-related protein n=1 Tax=Anaerobacterium chartisolvens TaxID=1297424 RepID=A0A369B1N8_9FIRM|nr:peptide maturation system acyl carrier-related protein [Anaerobacterium chartisolvens]RCX15469.1 peptide maturation system acyl carrier-related protein [Anaerobacterium chartisolvens]